LPLTSHIKLEDVDIAALQGPKATAQGLLSGIIEVDSDGNTAKASGAAKIAKLKASPKGQPATIPVEAKFDTEYTPRTEVLLLKTMDVGVGTAQAHITGTIDRRNQPASRVSIKADNAALVEIGKILPALGIIFPNNATFASGSLTNTGDFHGSFEPLNGQASINVASAKLKGFSVTEKVASVAKFAGLASGSDTEIQTLKCSANFVNGAATFTGIELVVPGLSVTGGGTMSHDGALDLKLNATLTGNSTMTAITKIAGMKAVPFIVRGTAQNPQFIPDVAGLGKNMVQEQIQNRVGGGLGNVLGGLLKKKKN
jgi:hypothetical protein